MVRKPHLTKIERMTSIACHHHKQNTTYSSRHNKIFPYGHYYSSGTALELEDYGGAIRFSTVKSSPVISRYWPILRQLHWQ
jgi:hypothetical protein